MTDLTTLDGPSWLSPEGPSPGGPTEALRRALALAESSDGDPDASFDEVYPNGIRAVSRSFWTPVRVALRAAELLVRSPATRVLDIGAGVGKFCIVGAAATGVNFFGVEHRRHFVRLATRASAEFGVPNAHFRFANFESVPVEKFDALYFFNPFEENLWGSADRLDETVLLSKTRFAHDVLQAERMLTKARIGTRVATYHGFGGEVPPGFRLLFRERHIHGLLDLWVKTEVLPWAPRPRHEQRSHRHSRAAQARIRAILSP